MCSAGGPPVLPPLEIPVLTDADAIQLDGDLTDWQQVVGPPTAYEPIGMWGDVTEGDALSDGQLDYAGLRSGLPSCRRIDCSSPLRDGTRGSPIRYSMDGATASSSSWSRWLRRRWPSDAATAQRVEVLPFAEGGLSVRYTGAVGAWRNTGEFVQGVTDSDPPKNREIATRVEVSLTVFDVVSDVGLQESVRSDLKVGDAITLGLIHVDVDPCDWCVSVDTYPATLARDLRKDASGFGTAILTRLEPPPTVVSAFGMGVPQTTLAMVVSGCRSTPLLIADLRRPMLRSMTALVLFAALPGICSAGGPPVLPPLEIPVLTEADAIQVDGDLTDWRQVIGPPILTVADTWTDPTESTICVLPAAFLDRDLDCRAAAGSRARRLRANR